MGHHHLYCSAKKLILDQHLSLVGEAETQSKKPAPGPMSSQSKARNNRWISIYFQLTYMLYAFNTALLKTVPD